MKDEDQVKGQSNRGFKKPNAAPHPAPPQGKARPHHTSRDWEDIFQAIGHPTLILDPKHQILAANQAAIRAIGRPEAEILGKHCYEIFHRANQPPEGCPLENLLASGHFETVEMEMETLGGVYLVSCTPVLDEAGRLKRIIHIATDITARK